jgi:hypothetical protein
MVTLVPPRVLGEGKDGRGDGCARDGELVGEAGMGRPPPTVYAEAGVAIGSSGLLGLAAPKPHPMPVVVGSVGTTEFQ